ncbi:MAG: phosphate ABC transporter substrate-binding protein PstS [Actinomycetota bacterium]
MNTKNRRLVLAGIVSLSLFAVACSDDKKTDSTTTTPGTDAPTSTGATTTTQAAVKLAAQLNASGATFPKTFYEEAIAAFTKANSGVTINYAGGGSGKGRQDLADQIVNWAGTDGTIADADLAKYKGGAVLYFPTVVAPITVSYNLSGVTKLQLSAETIAKIFQRQITKWNDAAIAADNPGVTLPGTAITVAHRSDSSGTTGNFTKFLDLAVGKGTTSAVWTLGSASTVQWPADTQAGEGNAGVAQIVKSTDGAIGYVDLSDAKDAGLKMANVKNAAGKFVEPTLDAASAAAAGAKIADNLTYSAIWATGDTAYPITAQTWIIAYTKQTDAAKGAALKAFLKYILTDGQKLANTVNFAPLPAALATKALAQLDLLVVG